MNGKELHELLGAYLLGGLDNADKTRFEDHLQQCGLCRRELADLKSLPGLLAAVPVPDAVALAVPAYRGPGSTPGTGEPAASVPQPVFDELAARRRTSRRRIAALIGGVAAACLALGFAAAPLLDPAKKLDASYSVQADTGIQVTVGMVKKTWGTELDVDGRRLPQDGKLSLWVKDRTGAEDRACAWMATPSGRVKVTSATPVQYTSIASVELRNDRQQTIAVVAVPGG
ncbi:anti-sigma factor [Arthrobacter sp. KBS0703]|uniref:zf-HC2 domain-containing protein n=1 Tax=Bacteria TaxID=2 RepID=UPI00098F265A|nr:zf-HC2 domain-containing protein [Arthrobacter sp. KBS0703]TSE17755.1 anti-sigma factor [Arthrobacter sp. KBS0703]